MDKLEIFKTIAAEAESGELVFPTNVNASLKLQKELDDPDCHMEAAAKLVQAEPLLSARTVAIANSAAYNRSGGEITNVRVAVMRLGFQTLRSLVAAMVVREFGNANTSPVMRAMAAQLWTHTAHVAALAQVIAKRVTHVDPDTAMFAGIIHEVGGFYVLSRANEYPGLLEGDLTDWIEYGETKIGRGVLKQLDVPESVTEAVEALWYGYRALPPETLGDTLLFANDMAPVPSPFQQRGGATTMESAATIDFEVGDGTLASILEESVEEVKSLTAALLM